MDKPILVIGGGGHAKVLINCLLLCKLNILGIVDSALNKIGQNILGVPIIGTDEAIFRYKPSEILLVNAIGSTCSLTLRSNVFESFKSCGYYFAPVIHPSAIIAADVVMDEGVQIMAGAIIQPGCRIGDNSIVNTRASVDHDCYIGDHVHVAPGVTLSGGTTIGDNCHVGTGAVIIQGISVGKCCLVAAGAVVVNDIGDNQAFAGVPAKEVRI